jgi:hypothetical protein
MTRFKKLLDDKGIDLRPGDDRQLLGFLRTAMCCVEKAVTVVEDFVELHTPSLKIVFSVSVSIFLYSDLFSCSNKIARPAPGH